MAVSKSPAQGDLVEALAKRKRRPVGRLYGWRPVGRRPSEKYSGGSCFTSFYSRGAPGIAPGQTRDFPWTVPLSDASDSGYNIQTGDSQSHCWFDRQGDKSCAVQPSQVTNLRTAEHVLPDPSSESNGCRAALRYQI